MSNYLSIAAVSATIAHIVDAALEQVFGPSATPRVRFGPPQTDPAFAGCTMFLYRVRTNAASQNDALPWRDASGSLIGKPRVALEAGYLFSFFGDDATLEPQRLLGAVVAAFAANAVLSSEMIGRAIAATPDLHGADLHEENGRVRILPRDIDEATMSQLWSLFPEVPYGLSAVYTASVIPIDAAVDALPPPPRIVEVNIRVNDMA